MNLKVVSAYNEKFKEISDLSFPTIESYCLINNFDCNRTLIENFEYPSAWFKIKLLIDELKLNKHEYILWIDSDAIIKNQSFKIKEIIDKKKALHISRDFNNINSGVMLWKNCESSLTILEKIWDLKNKYTNHIWWEQAALIELFERDFKNINKNTKIIDQSILNAYEMSYYSNTNKTGNITKDSFICHFPSLTMKTRIKLIKEKIKP